MALHSGLRSLPDQFGHYSSKGLIVMAILQSWSQGVELPRSCPGVRRP
ncbi:hypothetical protein AB4089_21930 [Arthrobacter sp. 2MCAF15]